ncbi:hypothetical protein SEA_BUMBLE_53 [Arthrobacter phage Bumble]|uniref:Uncharacterized protein n=1 Tax=Arthrobacter phage Bumble TaxID=2743904 RepID=A0A7G3VCG1_9CAUD|nr:hypothetical protein SEA_BUMBLE_53 [Arthrobacter phage Bumble]
MSPDGTRYVAEAIRAAAAREAAVERIRAELEAADLTRTGALVLLYDDLSRWEVRLTTLVEAGRVVVLRPDEIDRKAGLA